MRRAKAASCIDEEIDLQSILEEMAEKRETEKSEDGYKDNDDEDDDNNKEMDKDRFTESVGSDQGSLSQTPTSYVPILGPKVDHQKEIFLTPATSNELEKYEDFPSGSLQPEGLDVPDDDIRLGNKSEPILITNRSLSDSAASCHCSAESLVRPRSVETDNGLNIESTYKTDKGSSSLDSVSDEESLRRHRHSIPGHLSSYLSFLTSLQQKAAAIVAPAVPVFSTAVISGSTSSPDLQDNFTGLSFSSNIEGLGGVPPIRPLETLHNALSLKQLDAFLEHMALAQFRTPLSSPPKMPSTPKQSRSQPPPLGLQSPSSSKWSRESSLEVL